MGNCQAIDNATLVIQHPCGRVEKLYWPVTASEVMKMNPGHYVALLLTTTFCPSTTTATTTTATNNPVRITRIKLLRPTDTLVLGQVYRLITAQEVMKGLWAKKYAKMKKKEMESGENHERTAGRSEMENTNQGTKHKRHRSRASTGNSTAAAAAAAKSRVWQPSLRSISEGAS